MFNFIIIFATLFSVGYAHSYVIHGNAIPVSDVTVGADAVYRPQSSYAKPQLYSHPQHPSSGLSNRLPYNLPEEFDGSKLEHPIYYNAKQASYSYPQKTITILPTLYIPPLSTSYAPSANSYQSHHPADVQNVDAQPSYYPSTASQLVLPAHNSGYSTGSSDLYSSNPRPSGSILDIN